MTVQRLVLQKYQVTANEIRLKRCPDFKQCGIFFLAVTVGPLPCVGGGAIEEETAQASQSTVYPVLRTWSTGVEFRINRTKSAGDQGKNGEVYAPELHGAKLTWSLQVQQFYSVLNGWLLSHRRHNCRISLRNSNKSCCDNSKNIQVHFYNVTHLQHQEWKKEKCRQDYFSTRSFSGQRIFYISHATIL